MPPDRGDVSPAQRLGRPREHSIELLIVDDCEGGTGVLDLLYGEEGTFLSNILGMLCDYLDWQRTHEKGAYFYFGAETEPEIYDLMGLRQILQPYMRRYIREHDCSPSWRARTAAPSAARI